MTLQRLLGLRLWAELLGHKNEENRPSFQGPHSLLRKPDSGQMILGQWDWWFAGGRTRSERAAQCSLRGGRVEDDSQVSAPRLERGATHWDRGTAGAAIGEEDKFGLGPIKTDCHACGTSGGDDQMRAVHICLPPGRWQPSCVYPCARGAYLPRERELVRLGTFGAGLTMRMHRPMRIMQVGTAPMRTLRVTTTCSACLQAPDSYPAKLGKHHPTHPAQSLAS